MKLFIPILASFAATLYQFGSNKDLGMALTAWSIAYVTIPLLINFLRRKQIMDVPGERASHERPTPTLGGVGIFLGLMIAVVLWALPSVSGKVVGVGIGGMILFVTGIVDDLIDIPAVRKLLLQVLAAIILCFVGIKFESLNGLFGVNELPVLVQYMLTVLVIVGVTNAFNLMDGINGLAGGIGLISFTFLGFALKANGHEEMPMLAFTIAGAIIAFLHYNFRKKAAIFMGDTGSLILGFMLVVLGIEVFNLPNGEYLLIKYLPNPQVLAFATLFLPVIDALRVFSRRMSRGMSPLDPDKTHIHHVLLEVGCSHTTASVILWSMHFGLVVLGILLSTWPELAVVLLTALGLLLPRVLMSSIPSLRNQKNLLVAKSKLSGSFK